MAAAREDEADGEPQKRPYLAPKAAVDDAPATAAPWTFHDVDGRPPESSPAVSVFFHVRFHDDGGEGAGE